MTKKETVTEPQLGMEVFHEELYHGKELMEVVGIRKTEVELEGDYSGGMVAIHNRKGKGWLPIKGLFRLRKVCEQHEKFGTCQLPNVHCQHPHCEPYLSSDHHFDKEGNKIDY